MKISIAADHAGVELKAALIKALPQIDWNDLGPSNKDSVDYPDYADRVARLINENPAQKGVLICGSGQGMAMRANKYPQVRAALVFQDETTKLARQHNDANILCLGSRFTDEKTAAQLVRTFLETPFEGGRHSSRVAKVNKPTEC
ncbi:MAG: RpiB/LacA/LacB family sugar-phosphate isomerase [Bdellovibrionaceae bacterium]|nr:RpiB/LacA/LacB family sugar-phosphate isomerase [Pseudobdellovibrionaceae bacterium]MBX3034309.1 RpiB/LacA/LacB family sugar-phosphate isomerase [Pseudobdellovibrionaceae bacterium]